MTVITFSLPDESRVFLRSVQVTKRSGAGVGSAIHGRVHGVPIVVWYIGVGRERATSEVSRMLAEIEPSLVICAGYGGALQPGMQIGQIVESQPATNGRAELADSQPKVHTAATLLGSAAEKRRAGAATGALVVDLETAAVAELARMAGLDVLAVRAISDRQEDDLPVPMEHWFDLARQRPRVSGLLLFLARHPGRIMPFARFVRGLSVARVNLAARLVELIRGPFGGGR